MSRTPFLVIVCLSLCACGDSGPDRASDTGQVDSAPTGDATTAAPLSGEGLVAFSGATIWDGTGSPMQTGASLITKDGRVVAIADDVPNGADIVDLDGLFVVPGFVNAHGHVSGRWADESVTNAADRVRGDLALYARYGVTSVISLGGAGAEAFSVRDGQDKPSLNRARVKLAGEVVAASTPAEAARITRANLANGVDWIKLRVDDNLGTGEKMPWDAVHEAINIAREAGVPVATHIFYLEDAERLLEVGTGLIAHSVRDQPVTEAFTQAMVDTGVCYVPTLTREVSTFVYESRPDFFDDPFFLEAASNSEIERLSQPESMARFADNPAAPQYKLALQQARENLKRVSDAGVPVAFGTDTGPAGRFLGYFEHMEFDLMAESGMTPEQILLSATSVAADCVHLDDVGTLEAGKWADFVVLSENPLEEIQATRSIRDVYIAGNRIDR